jgi:hypothetical protein
MLGLEKELAVMREPLREGAFLEALALNALCS